MDVQVPDSERRWLHAVLVLGTLVLALILVSQVAVILVFFSDVLLVLLLAWLLAFILSPVVGLVLRAFPSLPRAGVVAMVYLALFVGLSWIILVVAGSLAASIGNFVVALPNLQARLPEILAPLQGTLQNLGFQVNLVKAAQDLFASLGNIGDQLVKPLTDLALFSLGIVANLLIIIFLSLFIVLDKERIMAYLNRMVPPRYSDTARLFETSVASSFGGFIRGQAIQGVVLGLFAAAVHAVLGIDFLPASAALSGVLQTIPFLGPVVSWAPPVVVAALTRPELALPALIAMVVGWFIVNNLVLPRVMAKAVGLHPVVVLVSVLIGLKIAGIAGAIFALPFAAVIAAFFQHFLGRNANLPRDVTSRAARRVGEREGRPVRVPIPPAIRTGAVPAGTPAATPVAPPVAPPTPTTPTEPEPRPAEPA
ncbi:MAG: AI-2E family transporter [Candidatus Limnocylindrales bacterium]